MKSKSLVALFFLVLAAVVAAPVFALDVKPPKGLEARSTKVKELADAKFWIECSANCVLPKDPKRSGKHQDLVLSGRIEERSVHRVSGASVVGPEVVLREYLDAFQKAGLEYVNAGTGVSGPHVFRHKAPGQPMQWVIVDNNFEGHHSLFLIEEKSRASTVSVTELAASLKTDGWATLYIEFDTNQSALKADGQSAVAEIVKLLQQDPGLRLSIDGHTDNVGDAPSNRKLALARAQAVQAAVLAQGIDAKRLSAKGFGPDVPIADNRREDGRAKNRRVELTRLP
jgi:hypothetical protein